MKFTIYHPAAWSPMAIDGRTTLDLAERLQARLPSCLEEEVPRM